MNKLSKLTALLLALVLALSLPLQVMAESAEIETKTEYYEVADKILQKMIMAYETYGEYVSMAEIIADEDFGAFLDNLPEDKLTELANYVNNMFWKACIPYTNVGPFKPAVDVTSSLATASTFSMMSRETTENKKTEGVELWKTIDGPDANGEYTITLDSFVTGEVSTSTVDVYTPVDIVLVLDTSGSMKYDVSSDDTTVSWTQTRRYALKEGVKTFIDAVAAESVHADHRISIVQFDSTASREADWTSLRTTTGTIDTDNVNWLKNDVIGGQNNGLDADGGTRPGEGLEIAYSQLTTDYDAPQGSTKRQKVVIFFTDGVPAYTDFEVSYAREAIEQAYLLKADPAVVDGGVGATVYSIAIFPEAYPETPIPSWTGLSRSTPDVQVVNAFLHAVSSNYPEARARTYTSWRTEYLDITPNDGKNDGYYLTANSVAKMQEIFQKISNNIQSSHSKVELGTTAVVKDVVTPYFDLPDNVDEVKVYTVDCTGFTEDGEGNDVPQWASTRVEYDDAVIKFGTTTASTTTTENADGTTTTRTTYTTTNVTDAPTVTTPKQNTVWVENFDYKNNYVANNDHDDPWNLKDPVDSGAAFYGRKLVVEFKIKPTEGFLGGNGVETNLPGSGIYDNNEDGVPNETIKDYNNPPNVDIAVPPLEIIGADQHIYLSNLADLDELLKSFRVQYYILDENGNRTTTIPYEVDTILNHYTQLTFTLKDGEGTDANTLATYTINAAAQTGTWTYSGTWDEDMANDKSRLKLLLTEDTPFYVSYEAVASATNYSGDDLTAWVYVYTPEVTFRDSVEQYMDPVTAGDAYYTGHNIPANNIAWVHPTYGAAADTNSPMTGTEPALTFNYTAANWRNEANQVSATADVPVTVTTAALGTGAGPAGMPLSGKQIKYIRIKCDECSSNAEVAGKCELVKSGVEKIEDAADGTDIVPTFVIHVYDVHGNLAISKTVKNDSSTLYAVDAKQKFIFTVTLKNGTTPVSGSYKCIILPDGTEGTVTFDNAGVATVELQHGQTITIEGITNGMSYKVEEAPVAGFTTTATVNDERVTSAEGNIVANATQNVAFTNTYEVGQLTVQKTITDNSGMYDLSGDVFSFTVRFSGTTTPIGYTVNGIQGTTENGAATFTLTKNQTATFDRIPAGVTYTVMENTNFPMAGYTKGTETNTSGTIAVNQISAAEVENIYNTGTLMISKTGMDAGEYAVFNATVVARGVTQTIKVVVPNGGSAVIKGLDLGSAYEVTEVGDWTWRYTSAVTDGSASGTIPTTANYSTEVAFTNKKGNEQWIDGNTYAENVFGDAGDSNATVERK